MSAILKKPRQWAFSLGLVAPEWGWFYKGDEGTWPLWENSGSSARDVSANRRDATLVGTDIEWTGSPLGITIHQTGTNDNYLDLGSASQFPMGATAGQPFTIGGLFTHFSSIPLRGNFGYFDGTRAFQQQTDDPEWRILYGISPFDNISGGSYVTSTARTFLVTFSDSGVGRFYINGTLIGTDASVTGDFTPSGVNFLVGARGTTSGGADNELDAYIHAFLIRSREWTSKEVQVWSRDPFGPFRMVDPVADGIIPAIVTPVSTDSLIPILKRRRR